MRKSRYQKGSVKKQRGRWVAMWWAGQSRKSRVIGLVRDMTKSDARAVVDRIVSEANARSEQERVWTFGEFVAEVYFPYYSRKWKASTRVNNMNRVSIHLVDGIIHLGYVYRNLVLPREPTLPDVLAHYSTPGMDFTDVLVEMQKTVHMPGGKSEPRLRWFDHNGKPTFTHPYVGKAVQRQLNRADREASSIQSSIVTPMTLYDDPIVQKTVSRSDCVGRLTMSPLFETFDLLTLADAAELLHCSKAHICKAVSGRVPGCPPIPAVSLGRRKLIRRETLRLWIENNERATVDGNISTLPERDAGKRA